MTAEEKIDVWLDAHEKDGRLVFKPSELIFCVDAGEAIAIITPAEYWDSTRCLFDQHFRIEGEEFNWPLLSPSMFEIVPDDPIMAEVFLRELGMTPSEALWGVVDGE